MGQTLAERHGALFKRSWQGADVRARGGRPEPAGQCSPGRFPPRLGLPSSLATSLGVMFTRPDILVLGAGGTLGEAWLRGVLGGIEAEAAIDFRDCEYFVGTSAGSIVAGTPP